MKCPICGGKGFVYNALGGFNEDCGICDGTGEIYIPPQEQEPLTNDEWRRTCSAEEFADWIVDVLFSEDFKKHIHDMGYANMHSYKTEVLEWLKEAHKE